MTELVLPYLAELGRRWEGGQASVAHEHFASNLLRGRLLGLARGWDRGAGPRAVLAAAPGELHDLPLIIFGLALWERGWRITYLGGDTPFSPQPTRRDSSRPSCWSLARRGPSIWSHWPKSLTKPRASSRSALPALALRAPLRSGSVPAFSTATLSAKPSA